MSLRAAADGEGWWRTFSSKYVNHARGFLEDEERRVNKQTFFLYNVSTSKTTPEYASAAGQLLCRMSLNKMFNYQPRHTHINYSHHMLFNTTLHQVE